MTQKRRWSSWYHLQNGHGPLRSVELHHEMFRWENWVLGCRWDGWMEYRMVVSDTAYRRGARTVFLGPGWKWVWESVSRRAGLLQVVSEPSLMWWSNVEIDAAALLGKSYDLVVYGLWYKLQSAELYAWTWKIERGHRSILIFQYSICILEPVLIADRSPIGAIRYFFSQIFLPPRCSWNSPESWWRTKTKTGMSHSSYDLYVHHQ